MRNIRIIILGVVAGCMGLTAVGQDKTVLDLLQTIEGKWKVSKNNNVYVQDIISCESKTKDQLYLLVKEYFANANEGESAVVQLDDKENGIIVWKGMYSGIKCTEVGIGSGINCVFLHFIKCEIKNNKLRITITLTKYEEHVLALSARGASSAKINEHPISNLYPMNTTPKDKQLNTREGYLFYKAVNRAFASIEAIRNYINSGSTDVKVE